MEALKKQRTSLKSKLTRLNTAVDNHDPDAVAGSLVRVHLNKLEELKGDFKIVHRDIIVASADAIEEAANEKDAEGTEEKLEDLEVKLIELMAKANLRENPPVQQQTPAPVQIQPITLKKLELPKFSGQYKDWPTFLDMFTAMVHDKQHYRDHEKLWYLKQALDEKVPEILASTSITDANYLGAWQEVQDRFNHLRLLITAQIHELLSLPQVSGESARDLRSLLDTTASAMRALKAMKIETDHWDPLLVCLLMDRIDQESRRLWEQSLTTSEMPKFDELKQFLTRRCQALEAMGPPKVKAKQTVESKKASSAPREDVPTAADLFSGQQQGKRCIFCDKEHASYDCQTVGQMSLEDRKKMLRDKKACWLCLGRGHFVQRCNFLQKRKCQVCGDGHHILLCSGVSSLKPEDLPGQQVNSGVGIDVNLASQCTTDVLLQTIVVRLTSQNKSVLLRALIDSGCQHTYITEKAAKVLQLKSEGQVQRIHSLFGGHETQVENHNRYHIRMESMDRSFSATFSALGKSALCGAIPKIPDGPWFEELKSVGINIVDRREENKDIHLLIGSDIAGKLFTGRIHPTKSGPVAWETKMGWLLMGKTKPVNPRLDSTMTVFSLHVSDVDIQDLWRLDVLGITDPMESKSRDDLIQSAQQHFLENVQVNEDGRFEVALPWVEGHPTLPTYRDVAEKRLQAALKKLKNDGKTELYQNVFQDWERKGIIEKLSVDESGHNGCYLPHRPVYNPKSATTPIRPVFDASAKKKGCPSLNDCLEKGPNLIELVPDVLMRFRMKKCGVISDIKKAFLQISVRPQDREFLRFLWWEEGNETPTVYQHCRVVFGVSSSPFLLAATLNYHLDQATDEYRGTAEKLRRSFYVDNCIASLDSPEEAEDFIVQSTKLMESGKFELHGWVSSGFRRDAVSDSAPVVVSVLGLLWFPAKDSLVLDLREAQYELGNVVTKRIILSAAHRLFDPVGFSCPVALIPKLILRDSWKLKLGWDQPVPEDMAKKFRIWQAQLQGLENIEIPRWVKDGAEGRLSLHTFTDASKDAFAACVFARTESADGVKVQLITAKARVAGTKGATVPRLELMGCLIGARLCHSVMGVLENQDLPCYYWTDSSNALYWIQKNENWATFVFNRVREINQLSNPSDWRHIPGEKNPADLPSRGCTPGQLVDSRWWEGPAWLSERPENWPVSCINPDLDIVTAEKKRTVVAQVANISEPPCYLRSRLNYRRTVRAMAYVRRWGARAKGPLEVGPQEEIETEIWLTRKVQQECFPVGSVMRKKLKIHEDSNGILRVSTKITAREDSEYFLQPILLPYGHGLVKSMLTYEHAKNGHCGTQTLMTLLREKFWIVKCRKMVRQVVHACLRCQRYRVKSFQPVEPALPVERVRDCAVFEVTGIDLGGPLYLKEGQEQKKAWFVVFTCAVYRAVHLELTTSLSSEAFLGCLRRFISRRGRPSIIYTDNGTNFEGLRNALDRVNWDTVRKSEFVHKIDWRFNPPSAPWWGGWWERLVGMVKKVLRRVLARACLNYERMSTILCDCEDILNSRPLGYVSEDLEDLAPLTPNMFLKEIKTSYVPDLDQLEKCDFQKKLRRMAVLRDDLRSRFRKEYLAHLVLRNKKSGSREVHVGDLVYIGSDDKKRIDWPLARVVKIFPGRDGVVRVARVKTRKGELDRPVQRLYPLELEQECVVAVPEEQTAEVPEVSPGPAGASADSPVVTRFGRVVNKPARFMI